MITAVPGATAVTVPFLSTVATLLSEDVYVYVTFLPPVAVAGASFAASDILPPCTILVCGAVSVTPVAYCITVIVHLCLRPEPSFASTSITAVPGATAVTLPSLLTLATLVSDDTYPTSVIDAFEGLYDFSLTVHDASDDFPVPRYNVLSVVLILMLVSMTSGFTLNTILAFAFLPISSVTEYSTVYLPTFLVLIFLTFLTFFAPGCLYVILHFISFVQSKPVVFFAFARPSSENLDANTRLVSTFLSLITGFFLLYGLALLVTSVGSQPCPPGSLIASGFPRGPGFLALYISTVVPDGTLSYIHLESATHSLTHPCEAVVPSLLYCWLESVAGLPLT